MNLYQKRASAANAMLVLREFNFGQKAINEKSNQTWIIYRNGNVSSNAEYESSGKTEVKRAKLSYIKLFKLRKLCDLFEKTQIETGICCDGTFYKIVLYDKIGREKRRFEGYIYGNTILESMKNIVCNIPGTYFPDWDSNGINWHSYHL